MTKSIKDVIFYALLSIVLVLLDYVMYYTSGQTTGPLLIALGVTVIILVITALALYESIKHRHDKEPW